MIIQTQVPPEKSPGRPKTGRSQRKNEKSMRKKKKFKLISHPRCVHWHCFLPVPYFLPNGGRPIEVLISFSKSASARPICQTPSILSLLRLSCFSCAKRGSLLTTSSISTGASHAASRALPSRAFSKRFFKRFLTDPREAIRSVTPNVRRSPRCRGHQTGRPNGPLEVSKSDPLKGQK